MALVVKSAVKQYVKKKGKRTSAEALNALEKEVKSILDKAVVRAGKKVGTIKARHIWWILPKKRSVPIFLLNLLNLICSKNKGK